MSVDVDLHDTGCCGVHSHNFTYNYSPALRDAGLPSWKIFVGLDAQLLGLIVGRVKIELMNDRPRFEPLIKGGGEWGTWESLMNSLGSLLRDCDKHPRARVSICG